MNSMPDTETIKKSITPEPSLRDIINSYVASDYVSGLAESTQDVYRRNAGWFLPVSAMDKPAATVSVQDIEEVLAPFKDRKGIKASLRQLMSASMREAIRLGLRQDNPVYFSRPAPPSTSYKRWPMVAVNRALEQSHGYMKTALGLLYYTGQRLSDVMELSELNRRTDSLYLKQKKTGTELTVPIVEELEIILALPSASDSKFYIANRLADTVRSTWQRERVKLGLDDYCLHGLRKTVACEAAEGGASEAELQALLGHRTSRAALLYRKEADQFKLASSAMSKRWK